MPDDPYLQPDLLRYFPVELQQRFPQEIRNHRLRREIIATQVANQMVNLSGISFDNRMSEDTGAGVVDVMRAWVASRDIFGFVAQWDEIVALAPATGSVTARVGTVRLDTQLGLFLELRRMVERGALWLLRHRRPPIDMAGVVAEFRAGITQVELSLESAIPARMREVMFASEAGRLAANVPEQLAQRSALWPLMHTGFDVVDLAARRSTPVAELARTYWQVFELLDLTWLWEAIGALPRDDRWQTQARSALRDDLLTALADLTDDALQLGSAATWASANEKLISRATALFTEIRRAESFGITTLSVALRQLRNLALVTTRPGADEAR